MHYVDTSALVKLVVREPETHALREWWSAAPRSPVTSAIARTELLRSVIRRVPERTVEATSVLALCGELVLDRPLLTRAGELAPATMRSLDAIHLASAERLGDDLDALVTYDHRLAQAVLDHGIPVIAPA